MPKHTLLWIHRTLLRRSDWTLRSLASHPLLNRWIRQKEKGVCHERVQPESHQHFNLETNRMVYLRVHRPHPAPPPRYRSVRSKAQLTLAQGESGHDPFHLVSEVVFEADLEGLN